MKIHHGDFRGYIRGLPACLVGTDDPTWPSPILTEETGHKSWQERSARTYGGLRHLATP
ncbi:unnamed protein product, partial [Nesidiocoris tenuis]